MKKGAAVAVVIVGLLVGWRHWADARAERPLAAVASSIAQRHVGVHCPSFLAGLIDVSGTAGDVQFPADGRLPTHTDLRDWVCGDLEHFRSRNRGLACVDTGSPCDAKAEQTIDAVVTLTHESFHLRGITDEARTQCDAIQTAAQTARELGAAPERADAIARYYLVHMQPLMPSDYQLPTGCSDGGPLDLHPGARGWPNPPST